MKNFARAFRRKAKVWCQNQRGHFANNRNNKTRGRGGVSIAKYETNWTAEDRYNMLVKMDKIVRACAPLYPIHAIWDKYGGGRRATESATEAWRDEVANDSEKFADALYAFVTCLVFDESWINSVINAEKNDER